MTCRIPLIDIGADASFEEDFMTFGDVLINETRKSADLTLAQQGFDPYPFFNGFFFGRANRSSRRRSNYRSFRLSKSEGGTLGVILLIHWRQISIADLWIGWITDGVDVSSYSGSCHQRDSVNDIEPLHLKQVSDGDSFA